MKRQNNISKRTRIITLALCAASCAAFGQGPGDGPGNGPGDGPPPPGRHGPPPPPPVIRALDTNHDGIVDATEIENAPQSLKTLLKSGSTSLSIPDLLGPPRGHRHHGSPGQGPSATGTNSANADSQGAPPPPPDGPPPDGQDGPPPPPPGGGGPGGHHHRLPPVIQALDTNHDGVVDATEIANAAQSLKTLENNGADQLTIPDLLGPPPRHPRPGGGDDQGGPPGPPPPPPDESGTNGQSSQAPSQ